VPDDAAYWPVPLPDYDRPPVVETVMAVHFARLRQLSSIELLDFWRSRLRHDYPVASERPAYQVPIEVLEPPNEHLQIQMELSPAPDRIRYWFQSESNENLVQLQNDWLAFNWRKVSAETGYRHYSYGAEQFERLYTELDLYCSDLKLGRLAPQQIEISYINHIDATEGGWSDHADLGRIVKLIRDEPPSGHLPRPQVMSLSAQYLATAGGEAVGRLYVEAQPRFVDSSPAFMVRLTYRGAPEGSHLPGVLTALDRGHHWIVGGFDELTTTEMHDLWGRKERDA
jgi:uncharacterized protein (TIGR04255 family)